MKFNAHSLKISTLFDVLGYSLIGILAYIFGLFLQDYNTGKHDILEAIRHFSPLGQLIIVTILFQLVLILSFGKIYASSILAVDTKSTPYKVFTICLWIFLGILSITLSLLRYTYDKSIFMFFLNIITLVGIYLLNYLVFKLKLNKKKYESLKRTSRYVLVCPAILMIGVNIYYGASLYDFIEGDKYCILVGMIFLLFFVFMYLFNTQNIVSYIIFILLFLVVGLLALPVNVMWKDMILPMKNVFLGIAVAIFLSIFESWYVIFRQLHNNESNAHIKVTGGLIIAAPPIIFLLFPIQDFHLVYILAFSAGMMYTDIKWFFDILPFTKSINQLTESDFTAKKKNVALSRAACGIITLVCLMIDKYSNLDVPSWNEKYSIFDSGDLLTLFSIAIGVLPILIPLIKVNFKLSWDFFKDLFSKELHMFILVRHVLYALIPFVGHRMYGYLMADTPKSYFSITIMLAYMIIEALIIFFKIKQQKGVK